MSRPHHGFPSPRPEDPAAPAGGSTAAGTGETRDLSRGLKARHIEMIGLGGAIGTGLFYGSSDSIGQTGVGVVLGYLLGGLAIYLIVRAMGEMSVDQPVSGAFSHYAYENWSERAGFVSGWNYWFNYIAVAMVELSVVGQFVNYWFPEIPHWVSAAFFLVVITGVNLIGVRLFGEIEFWFAAIKVLAVLGMIVLGVLVVVFGVNHNPELPAPSFHHLADGGLLPHGTFGLLGAMVVIMFSFGGTELVGITAGEAEDPDRTIPRAINQVILRILLFYVAALVVIMAVIPWRQIDDQMSPFVQIFDNVGIMGAANILNFVVLIAVVSVYNAGLYSNGRMLYSLAHQGNAPAFLRKVSRRGVPWAGVLVSSGITVLAVVVVFLWPDFAFRYLLSIATISAIINWSMIMVTQWKFRRRIGPEAASRLAFRLPGGRVTTVLVLAYLAGLVVVMAFMPDYRTAVVLGPIWLAVLLVAFQSKKAREKRLAARPE